MAEPLACTVAIRRRGGVERSGNSFTITLVRRECKVVNSDIPTEIFLEALCGDQVLPGEALVLAGEDPKGGVPRCLWTPGGRVYPGLAWFTLCLQEGNNGQWVKGDRKRMLGALGLVIDDVGTKGPGLDWIEPWAEIETRRGGSRQWIVRFSKVEPMRRVERMCHLLSRSGAGDPEGNWEGRLGRLPGSQPTGKDVARLVAWRQDRWDAGDIEDVLEWMAGPDGVREVDTKMKSAVGALSGSLGLLRRLDPVFDSLVRLGWVRANGPNSRGGWPVRCPNEHLHRSGGRSHINDSVYFPHTGGGAFSCFRGHVGEQTGVRDPWREGQTRWFRDTVSHEIARMDAHGGTLWK